MQIGGLQKTSLLDFPQKISAIVFTKGCNFKCGYCHNPELFSSEVSSISEDALFDFLKTRIGKLDGVVITGGEPTLHNDLPEFISKIKDMGFLIKLDTNGTNPEMLEKMINQQVLDYIAMDIKAPLKKYKQITNSSIDISKIKKSIELIMKSGIDYEFRTTVLKSQLSYDDFEKIVELILGAKKYFLQKFVPSKILDNSLANEKNYTDSEFEQIKNNLLKKIYFVDIR